MIDLTWKLFRETGNIETYLLMKELEMDSDIEKPENDSQTVANEELT
ncbi:YqzL family protein [Virgibacillus sp. 179-BFC.A HS]|uniref:YqzL family protein n=1 Tax=Tigheibacillus jepli TaxID=3035914 RepID=A0ABU5CGT2_9BACI|nr:YqzL family protein [Virgibacillus sp. 179-BFC.A HS]MDY0405544.1 YqzL family protein [Virgibacillus sp. 179-BFC.A HS]